MLKRAILKASLTMLVSLGLVIPAFADVSISGRVRAGLEQNSKAPKDGDTASTMDIKSDYRLNFNVGGEAGGWKASATVRMEKSDVASNNASVTVENDTVAIKVGNAWYLDTSQLTTGYKGWGNSGLADDAGFRRDGVNVSLKGLPVNASIFIGLDSDAKLSVETVAEIKPSGDTLGNDAKSEEVLGNSTQFGLGVSGSAGPLGYGFTYFSESTKGDKNRASSVDKGKYGITSKALLDALNKLVKDGADKSTLSKNTMILHLAYTGVENLGLGFTYGNVTSKKETVSVASGKAVATTKDKGDGSTTIQLIAKYQAGDHTIGFTYQTASDDADKKTTTNTMALSYNVPVGSAKMFANYASVANSGDGFDAGKASQVKTDSTINVGLHYDF